MADYFCDHGAYGLASNRLGLDAPVTWGVPQEGDGSTKDAATASSVASIAFATVPTSGLMSVCGISIGTTGVIGAATVSAAADALAGLINAVATTVAAGVAVGTPQLKNLVYARGPTLGAPAGTCQIMMRIGSTTLNQATNASAAIASTFNGSPTLVQFVGGSGGCWGWLVNPIAFGVSSSITIATYGTMFTYSASSTNYVCSPAPSATGDTTFIRSGTNPVITLASNQALRRSAMHAMQFIVDTNTVWTGDSAVGVVTFSTPVSSSSTLEFYQQGSYVDGGFAVVCLRKHNLVFSYTASIHGSVTLFPPQNSNGTTSVRMSGVLFEDACTSTSTSVRFLTGGLSTGGGTFYSGLVEMTDCTFRRNFAIANLQGSFFPTSAAQTMRPWLMIGCSFEYNITGATPPPAFIALAGGAPVGNWSVRLVGCKFSGWPAGGDKFVLLAPLGAGTTLLYATLISAIGCSGLSLPASYAGITGPSSSGGAGGGVGTFSPDQSAFLFQRSDQAGSFRYENLRGVVEFDAYAAPAYPTFAATLPSGAAWSLKAVWIPTALVDSGIFSLPPMTVFYRDAPAAKTITLNLLIRTALASLLKTGRVVATVSYTSNTDGMTKTVSVESVPATSAASWSGIGDYPGYEARKLTFAATDPIKTDTEISIVMGLVGKTPTGVTETIYIDPQPGVA